MSHRTAGIAGSASAWRAFGVVASIVAFCAAGQAPPALAQTYDLVIEKKFANEIDEGVPILGCVPGSPCNLRLVVTNRGQGAFAGDLAAIDVLPDGWSLLPAFYPPGQSCQESGTRVECTAETTELAPGDTISWSIPLATPAGLVATAPVQNCFSMQWKDTAASPPLFGASGDACIPIPVGDKPASLGGRPFILRQAVGNDLVATSSEYMDDTGGCLTPAPCKFLYTVQFGKEDGTTGTYEGDLAVTAVFTDVDREETRFSFSSYQDFWQCRRLSREESALPGFRCEARSKSISHLQYLPPIHMEARFKPRAAMAYSTVTCAVLSYSGDAANGIVGADGSNPLDDERACDRRRMEHPDRDPVVQFSPVYPNGCREGAPGCVLGIAPFKTGSGYHFGDLSLEYEFEDLPAAAFTVMDRDPSRWTCTNDSDTRISCRYPDAMLPGQPTPAVVDMQALRPRILLSNVPPQQDTFRVCVRLEAPPATTPNRFCRDLDIVRSQ